MSAIRTSTEVPSIEPLEINAGDVLEWTRDLGSDFPSTLWTVSYYVRGRPGKYDIATTGSGSIYTVSVTDTDAWLPEIYALTGFADNGTRRIQIYDGKLQVRFDPLQVPEGIDVRSHAKKCLDAIESVIEQRATRPEQEYKIEGIGRQFVYKTDEELLKLRDYYLAEYQQELNEDMIRRGENVVKNIGVRFRQPW